MTIEDKSKEDLMRRPELIFEIGGGESALIN